VLTPLLEHLAYYTEFLADPEYENGFDLGNAQSNCQKRRSFHGDVQNNVIQKEFSDISADTPSK